MSVRTFHLKTVNKFQISIDDSNCSTLNDFINKIINFVDGWNEKYDSLTLIYSGKKITDELFQGLATNQYILVVPRKKEIIIDNKDVKFTREESRLTTLCILNIIKGTPELYNMFMNDFTNFIIHFNSPNMINIYNAIINQSDKLLDSSKNSSAIKLFINGDNSNIENINISDIDKKNINDFVEMGFLFENVFDVYIKNNKNVDLTLEKLLG